MFSVREMPWHRQGIVLGDYPGSWDEARKLAGLDWEPVREPVFEPTGETHPFANVPLYREVDGWKRIVRSDTHDTLSVRPDSWHLIDHAAMGEIIEAILEQPGVKYETAGCLDGGRAVWCLAMLDEPITLPGDNSLTLPFMAVTNRHDGLGSCAVRATGVRIVCANTFRAAELEGERTGATFAFRHTKHWRDRIEQARAAVTATRKEMADYAELARLLLGVETTEEQRRAFVDLFIPLPPEGLVTERVRRNVDGARVQLRDLIDESPTTEGIRHTAYGLVQGAVEYLDHVRAARSWETRLGRTLMRPEPLKAKALKLTREVCMLAA
jgi:phage/plasmid-like protein (TIGR03299 family)